MKKFFLFLMSAALLAACSGEKEPGIDELRAGFDNPPQEARTQVWWHWLGGNVTRHGIREDLEWMDRIGLGGFHHFDAALASEQIVDKRLIYMEDDWKDALGYAAKLADSLGLEMTIASCPGWSATGAPWVQPKDAMKKLVWRTEVIEGGRHYSGKLPEPFRTTGAFQNAGAEGRGSASVAEYYEDVAVIAMPLVDGDLTMEEMGAKLTSSGGEFRLAELCDDDLTNGALLPNAPGGQAWVMFEFPEPQLIRAVTLSDGRGAGRGAGGRSSVWLESSEDGRNFSKVADLQTGGAAMRTVSVPATTAKYFRVVYRNAGAPAASIFGRSAVPAAPSGTKISELVLHSASQVHRSQDKSAFTAAASLSSYPTPASPDEQFTGPESVLDISDRMDSEGNLEWDVPEGRWKVWRFGYSLTGKQNHPAPPDATGLEVDKLDPVAWTNFFHTYFDLYKDATDGLIGKRGVQYVLNDSYEAEQENWTPAMFEEFQTRRGYDLHKWMPVLAGAVIGSPEQSDAFLWDWRKTIGDLITANYDLLTEIAVEEYGMKGRYTEAHEGGRVYPVDGMDVKRNAAVPMSAMWVCAPWLGRTPDGDIVRSGYIADCQESASVAHVYGQNIAAAESLTAWGDAVQYSYTPRNLKSVADLELACGINRFVIHESAHQPSDTFVPGLSMGMIGQWFNRHDTWAEQAGVWVDYMSRSSYMLQAGHNVADVLVYYGEDANITSLFSGRQPALPYGYKFDYLNPDGLLNQIVMKDGTLASKSGTRYRVLWLERNNEVMSVDVLKKILSLVEDGAVVCGPRPLRTGGLLESREEFDSLVSKIWDSGRKNVYENTPIAQVLADEAVMPDVISDSAAEMRFLHRTLDGVEIYWINKPSDRYLDTEVSFRVSGLKPEIWHPDNGTVEPASYRIEGDRTVVKLGLVPDDAVFVVFSGKAEAPSVELPEPVVTELATLDGPWNVEFQEGRGAPESAVFDELKSLSESDEFGIRYFSGVADYTSSVSLPAVEGSTVLDLGEVGDLAEVYVNGRYCGTAWKEPFRVDVSEAVREGENQIEIKVVNTWVNRLIGDEQPDCPEQITYVDTRQYKADTPLHPSGLIGPVKLMSEK